MKIELTIPDLVKDRVIDAICARYGYDDPVLQPDGSYAPRTETKPQFGKQIINKFLKDTVKDYEGEMAYIAAKNAAVAQADSDITLS